jgi:hypothetical protein
MEDFTVLFPGNHKHACDVGPMNVLQRVMEEPREDVVHIVVLEHLMPADPPARDDARHSQAVGAWENTVTLAIYLDGQSPTAIQSDSHHLAPVNSIREFPRNRFDAAQEFRPQASGPVCRIEPPGNARLRTPNDIVSCRESLVSSVGKHPLPNRHEGV